MLSESELWQLKKQCLLFLVKNLEKISFIFPISTTILAWLYWEHASHVYLTTWVLGVYIISFFRFILFRAIENSELTKETYHYYLNRILIIDLFTGIIVGSTGYLVTVLPPQLSWLQIIVVIVITVESVSAQSIVKASFLTLNIPIVIVFSLFLLIGLPENNLYIFALSTLHSAFLYTNFLSTHKTLRSNLELSYKNQSLIEQLQQKNAALELSEKQLKVANEAKSNFIAEISQVFRVPLANLATILRINPAQSTYYQMKSTIELASTSVETMLSELDELIAIKSLAFGMVKKSEVSFNVREHFDRVMKQFAEHAISKNLRSYCFIRTHVPLELKADIKHIDQMVQNLLSNALKFTDKGYISLVVDFEAARDSNQLIIAVNDTGVGIEADKIDYIFQPFVKSTQAFEQGKGLGLTFCQQIVQSLNGEISVRSEPNKLTTFTVKIPVAIAKLAEKVPFDLKQKRIVIVEQNQLAKQELVERVSFFAAPYITLDKAKDALAVCAKEKNNVALVIIGRQEPLQLLINLTQRLSIPCVVLSPLPQAEQNNKLLTHLTYPLCHHELAQILAQYYANDK